MWPVSDKWNNAIGKTHKAVAYADLYRNEDLLASRLPLINASVSVRASTVVRRTFSGSLVPTPEVLQGLTPITPSSGGLWPLGNELQIYDGIIYDDGTEEYVPQGRFRISRPRLDNAGAGTNVALEGFDRGRSVQRSRFTKPYIVEKDRNYAEAIKELMLSRLPLLNEDDLEFVTTPYLTPLLFFTSDDDPMEVAVSMANSIGCELFFDGLGKCVMRPQSNPATDEPVAVYDTSQASNTMTSNSRVLDEERAYNGVIVVSENTDLEEPIRGEAWDTNPNSPTYYDPANPTESVYGAVPHFINTKLITTQAQADEAAAANLTRVIGAMEAVTFSSVANPAHQGGDVIQIEDLQTSITGTYVLEDFTLQLGLQRSMQATTRQRRSA